MKKRSAIIKIAAGCSKGRFKLATIAVLWMLILAPSAGGLQAQESAVVDRIVAVVNADVVTLYDLNRAFRPFETNIKALRYPPEKERQTLFQVRSDILNQLIDSQLADQQIKRYQISVNQKEIDSAIERIKEARAFTDEQLRAGLAAQGLTMEEYRKEIEAQILRTKLVNREVKSKIVITQEDIKAYYEGHKEKYAGARTYYLWNIFIKASPSEKEAALKEIQTVEAKLKQGASFGLYRREELSAHLQKVVENMKAGDYSQVLDTNFGFQIIYVQKIQETESKPLSEVESDIKQLLYSEYVDNRYQEWLKELRERSYIKIIQ
jgi:peptidyl-prolyl cis-trans isomerase SurA